MKIREIEAEFPNSVSIIVNVIVTLKFVIVNEQPQCNGHFWWRCELASPVRPKFSITIAFTIMGTEFGNSA